MFRKRLLTSICLILLLIGSILISHQAPILFFLAGNVVVILGMREFLRMTDGIRGLGILGGALVFSVGFIASLGANPGTISDNIQIPVNLEWLNAAVFLVVVSFFLFQATRRDGSAAIARISTTIAGIIYVSWLFSFIPRINYYLFRAPGGEGIWYIFFLFLVVKVNDSGAYLVGSRWGRHKLIPRISPGKTVEGAVAGVMAGGLAAIGGKFAFHLVRLSWPAALTLGIILGVTAVAGDLAESLLKRDSGVKDSGRTLPGMGGVLDLMDSIYFTAPLLYFYMKLILKL
jgi:phosphatidate cytidylyltransferase